MKKLVCLIALMTVCIGQTFAYNFVVNGIYYNYSGKEATVTYRDSNYKTYKGNVVIPSTVSYSGTTYNVTNIGSDAFRNCSDLNSALIPNSITSIGGRAFYGSTSLTSIIIPNSVTSIGGSIFYGCTSLASVTLSNKIPKIGAQTFEGCTALTSITIPNSVTVMESSVFRNCSNLTFITFDGCRTSIGSEDFYGCSNLASINLTDIGAWCECSNLNNLMQYGKSSKTLYINGKEVDNLIIPDGTTSLPNYAFRNFKNIKSVTIPASMPSIGQYTFDGCGNLTSVTCLALVPPTIQSNTFNVYGTLHVVEGCKDAYAASAYWKNFTIIDDIRYNLPEISFTDGENYSEMLAYTYDKVTYTRTFSNTNWQALYVPFSMDYEEWSEKYDIAEINNFVEYDDDDNGVYDRTYLVVLKKTSGSTKPNTPYLIRAKETGTHSLVLQNKTLEAAESTSIDCSSVKNRYTFTGTYTPVTDMYANGYYALSGGALNKANSAGVTLGAQRWYMEVTSRTGGAASAKAQTIQILVDCEEGIETPSASPKGESPVAYDLMGRMVSVKDNVRGVNIVNGRKLIK